MGFGYTFANAEQSSVLDSMERYLLGKGFVSMHMTRDKHPRKMKLFHENRFRLYWVSPRLTGWTGIFEFRYYNNEVRERWGYADEHLSVWLSKELAVPVYRMEVVDTSGFWMYTKYEGGAETAYKVFEDRMFDRPPDPAHPRYELNRLIEREGIRNAGLGYENIPGPMVAEIEGCRFWDPALIVGYEGFVHRAYEAPHA